MSSAAASILVASGFVATESAAADCAENDGEQSNGSPSCDEPDLETRLNEADANEDLVDGGVVDVVDSAVRERPCCAGQDLTDQQIQELPQSEWTALKKWSDVAEQHQEELVDDIAAYDAWELVYDEANTLAQQSALALENNDISRAKELHQQAAAVWSKAPHTEFYYGISGGRQVDGVERSLAAIDSALKDDGRPVVGSARAKLNLPELPSRVVDSSPEPEVSPGEIIAFDDLEINSLGWTLDEVLSGDPHATRTVIVTIVQAESDAWITAEVAVALLDGEIVEVSVDGVPVQSVRDRVERDLNRIRGPRLPDDSPLPDSPEMPGSEETSGVNRTDPDDLPPPIDTDFTSSIDANIWISPTGTSPSDSDSPSAVNSESELQPNTVSGGWADAATGLGREIWLIEDWLSQTSSRAGGFGGSMSFGADDVTWNNVDEADDEDSAEFSLETGSTLDESDNGFSSDRLLGEGFSSRDSFNDSSGDDSFGVDLVDWDFGGFSFTSDSVDAGLFSAGSSTNGGSDQSPADVDSSKDDSDFEDLSFDSSLDVGTSKDDSDSENLSSESWFSGLGSGGGSSSDFDDGFFSGDSSSGFDWSSGDDSSSHSDLSFESSLESNSFTSDDSDSDGLSFESSVGNASSGASFDINLDATDSQFGDFGLDGAPFGGGTGDVGFSPAGGVDVPADEPTASSSEDEPSSGFSFSFGGFNFDW